MKNRFNVAVLLTTYNSSSFIEEQLRSIENQLDIEAHIFISDDFSSDDTLQVIQNFKGNCEVTVLANKSKYGKPGLNFFSLVERVFNESFDFYCFADHDDIWQKEKLIEAIELLKRTRSLGYSSAFHIFYGNHQRKIFVSKNPIQKKFDHLYSSPGPGCTFVLEKNSYSILRRELIRNKTLFLNCEYHDWAIYAFYRANNLPWVIDDRSFINYRQHESNDTGANKGLKAYRSRLSLFLNGTYENQVRCITQLTRYYDSNKANQILKLNKFQYLYFLITETRRNFRDRLIIFTLSILGLVKRRKIFN